MSITLGFEELLAFTDEERHKWNEWLRAQPPEIWQLAVQEGGRFPTVWSLLDHVMVVEQRHLQRLQIEYPLPDSTGVAEGRWDELWEWARQTRQQLREYSATLDEQQATAPRQVQIADVWVPVSPRKLLFHVLLHEIRHWAQLALVFRNAGLNPPGDHDLVFSSVLQ
jgi:uncharacterized damage-inducible protein DinB